MAVIAGPRILLRFEEVKKTISITPVRKNFKFETGAIRGAQGYSAYEVWVRQPGNENKTVDEYLTWLADAQIEAVQPYIDAAEAASTSAQNSANEAQDFRDQTQQFRDEVVNGGFLNREIADDLYRHQDTLISQADIIGLSDSFSEVNAGISQLDTWATGTAIGGTGGDGKYPINAPGGSILVPSPAAIQAYADRAVGYARPLFLEDIDGHRAYDPDHDWGNAWATALGECASTGGKRYIELAPGRVYPSGQALTYDPTTTTISANGGGTSHHLRTFVDPTTMPDLAVNGGFDSNANWVNGAEDITSFTIGGGKLVHAATTSFGQLVSATPVVLVVGKKYSVKVTIDQITPTTDGTTPYRSVNVYMRAGATGGGTIGFKREIKSTEVLAAGTVIEIIYVPTFAVNYWRIDTQAGVVIDSVTIKEIPNNAMFNVAASLARGHMAHEIRDMRFRGTGDATKTDFVRLFDMATLTAGLSSRMRLRGCESGLPTGEGGGIGVALYMGPRTYLVDVRGCRLTASYAGIQTEEGSPDAGENILIQGGNFGGGKYGVLNMAGFAIGLDHVSIDFVDCWLKGSGITGANVWLETAQANFHDPDIRLIDVTGGLCDIQARVVQIDNFAGPFHPAPFRVAEGARLILDARQPYGLKGTTGALCDGGGEFIFQGKQGSNKNIDNITKRDNNHNVMGYAFNSPNIIVPVWLAAATGQTQYDAHKIGYAAKGVFNGTVTRNAKTITGVAPGGYINVGTILTDDGWPSGTTVATQALGTVIAPKVGGNTGNGTFTVVTANLSTGAVYGVYTVTFTDATHYTVYNPTGVSIGAGTTGTAFSASGMAFTIPAGTTPFVAGDGFTLTNTYTLTASQTWNPAGATLSLGYRLSDTDAARSTISMEDMGDGTFAINITKRGVGKGVATTAYLAIKAEARRAFGAELSYEVLGGLTGTGDVYFQAHFAQVDNIQGSPPVIGPYKQYMTEKPVTAIDMAVGASGVWSFGTNQLSSDAQHNGYAPAWNNVYTLISISLVNMPNGAVLRLKSGHANPM